MQMLVEEFSWQVLFWWGMCTQFHPCLFVMTTGRIRKSLVVKLFEVGGWIELTCHLARTSPSGNKQIDIRVWIKWVYFMVCQTQKRVAFISKMSSRHKQQGLTAPILISPSYGTFEDVLFPKLGHPVVSVLDSMLYSNTNGFTSWMAMDFRVTFHFPMQNQVKWILKREFRPPPRRVHACRSKLCWPAYLILFHVLWALGLQNHHVPRHLSPEEDHQNDDATETGFVARLLTGWREHIHLWDG